jgi:hypothetical protein
LRAGGCIYDVRTNYRWPGMAAVIVSIVHASRQPLQPARLNQGEVPRISAFLVSGTRDEAPALMGANAKLSYVGSYILGQGFTFDDTAKPGTAPSPLATMHALIAKDSRNQQLIFPYLGGEELNSSPTQSAHRYVINFGNRSLEEAEKWPDLLTIVRERVKPERDTNNRETYKKYWWHFGEKRPELTEILAQRSRVLACSQVSSQMIFAWQPTDRVFAHTLNIFPLEEDAFLATLQSRVHEIWARFFGSSMKNDLRYTPSDCFETFPFPPDWRENSPLNAAGKAYHEHRAALCVRLNEGLTAVYNRFHDPQETDPGIAALRALHAALDRAVLDAYGWTDLAPTPEFVKEDDGSEEEAETEWAPSKRAKREKFRLKWTETDRDAVFARLLDLNATRAAEEAKSAPTGKKAGKAGIEG